MSVDDETSGWQLTESDPGVFSELLKSLGVSLIVDDLYSLDSDSLSALQPLRAFIFLFKWIPTSSDGTTQRGGTDDPDFAGFFAHQVVNNACATLAVLNALGNIPSLATGPQLAELLQFARSLDPQTRGLVITSSDWLRETEDAYHFVVYLPVMGALYELDGLKPHALRHGAFDESGEGWLKTAREAIEARINTYPVGALEFSLLALRDDPLPSLQSQLEHYQATGDSSSASEVFSKISNENAKRERWAFENSLRRHNHVGLVQALLLALAKGGKLLAAEEDARKAMKEPIMSVIALIAAGAMGAAVGRKLVEAGNTVLTNPEGRSDATRSRAAEAGMINASWADIVQKADILLSIVPPRDAVALAKRVLNEVTSRPTAEKRPLIFADCNAINVDTVKTIAGLFADAAVVFLDGCIIGGPPSGNYVPTFYASADPKDEPSLKQFEGIIGKSGIKARVLNGDGADIGDASALKMSYAGLSKGITGLFTTIILGTMPSREFETF
ncbi:hypothetical protein NLJ89_g10388 [Agrocybe chaxingu]|uniref:Ubiquitin carboxyl-terminal hydrolase n=1 Tax=Agrocybe chaxingu TaxID=84603 RepID=A0A9W8MS68_9AGAR|nr:hypothetical protein NLJ89_g10388 [Agrocybe chaxingu]